MNDIWKVGLVLKMRAGDGASENKRGREREKRERKRESLTCKRNPELADQHIDHPVGLPWLEVVVQLVILLPNIIRQRIRGPSVSSFHRSQQLIFFDEVQIFPEDVAHVARVADAIHNQRQHCPGKELHLGIASLVPTATISSPTIR
jgi:hypothetical protein